MSGYASNGSDIKFKLQTSGNSFFNGGNVGVGTSVPVGLFSVHTPAGSPNQMIVYSTGSDSYSKTFEQTSSSATYRIPVNFSGQDGNRSSIILNNQSNIYWANTSSLDFGGILGYNRIFGATSDFRFQTFRGGTTQDNLTIKSMTGFVGISTTAPQAMLHVHSTSTVQDILQPIVRVTSSTSRPGIPVAEFTASSFTINVPTYGTDIYSNGTKLSATAVGGYQSTTTIKLQSGNQGGLYLATSPAQSIDSWYNNAIDTFNISNIQFVIGGDVSTMTAKMGIVVTTEPVTNVNLFSIHTQSFTLVENLRINISTAPDTRKQIFPNERMYLYCPVPISSGTSFSNVQALIRGFFNP
jgi:hypothetical protein